MIVAQEAFIQGQGLLVERFRLAVAPLRVIESREIVEDGTEWIGRELKVIAISPADLWNPLHSQMESYGFPINMEQPPQSHSRNLINSSNFALRKVVNLSDAIKHQLLADQTDSINL